MSEVPSSQATVLLRRWAQGDENAIVELVPIVYAELRRVAHYYLEAERPGHTLQSAALVNEVFLRLLGRQPVELQNRAHFVAVASRLMRQILVDYARIRRADKRDGGQRIDIEAVANLQIKGDAQLVALDDALRELSRIDERQATIVDMRFFGGLSKTEISQVSALSRATIERDWATARVWLRRQMGGA